MTATALGKMMGFVTSAKPDEAKAFYANVLGFRFVADDGFALVFDAHGTTLRIAKAKEHTPMQGTILGWETADIYAAVKELAGRGKKMEQFGFAFMKQDEHGVWDAPGGAKVAWFKDPDGNTLSLTQSPR
jgi:catechol 2,3-dioxygenase-like lactoylglutathione lyase family enzyme